RNDSRPRFPHPLVRGCGTPQGTVGKNCVRAKRENTGVRFDTYGLQDRQPLAGIAGVATGVHTAGINSNSRIRQSMPSR
ncbi:hypothetical protein, partial [Bacteroides xylanisolvens]|uniref:hypothetical protein n=1 Tax=Bacteroides xylanisolvens TaxID=371601 RepID=UPI001863E52E